MQSLIRSSASAAAMSAAAPEQPGCLMDERDSFISWLRSEFAATNAIIDHLVRHLCSVGDPGEYDQVCAAVQERRHHWAPTIHMQQFFTVSDIAHALQQSKLRHRALLPQPLQPRSAVPPSLYPSPCRSSPFTPSHHRHGAKYRPDWSRTASNIVASAGADRHEGEKNPRLQTVAEKSSEVVAAPLEYTTSEIIDGKLVNTVEGLKVYEGLIDMIQIEKITSLIDETIDSSHRGQLKGQTVTPGKRPLRSHGSVVIQLGVPIIEGPLEDENQRETRVEAVPGLLHDLFDCLLKQGIVPSKPDYCVVDFYSKGEYSHPQQPPSWYGRPLCTLCLTDCDMVFGKVILGERGVTKGPLKLSLSTGSLVVLQGRSADVAKRCIPATCKQRILLTFGKSVPRKLVLPEGTGSSFLPDQVEKSAMRKEQNCGMKRAG